MFFHPMQSFVTLEANANRSTDWNEACCVLDHQAFGVKLLRICICLFSAQCMKLTQNGKFISLRLFLVFSCYTILHISIIFHLMYEFNFPPCPSVYFICTVYERCLITFDIGIPSKICFQYLIFARSIALQ